MQDSPHAAPAPGPSGSSDALLRLIADSVPALMAYYDLPGLRCQFANQGYAAYNGHSTQSILGLTVEEAIGTRAWEAIHPHVDRCMVGERVKYTREQTLPNSEIRIIEVNLIPHFEGRTDPVGAFVLINDITERWRAESMVRQSEERMRKFSEATDEAIVFHRDGIIIDGNEALTRLTGYPLHEVLGLSIFSFIHPEYRSIALEYTRSGSEHPYEVAITHKDGHNIPVEVVGKTMPQLHGDYRIVVARDISARKKVEEREAFLALHDALTELPNRRHLMEQLERQIAQAQQANRHLAVLFIDLDHFKTVNDSLGHHAGDQLLCEVAHRFTRCVRSADIVARLGGDEFVVILNEVGSTDDVVLVAEKILAVLDPVMRVEGHTLHVTPSIGISVCPDDGWDLVQLMKNADTAMYHAKAAGRNNFQFFDQKMNDAAVDRLKIEHALRLALVLDVAGHIEVVVGEHIGRLDEDGGEARHEMRVDVAVEEPGTRVVSAESEVRRTTGRHYDCVAAHGVDLRGVEGWVDGRVVRCDVLRLVDDLEMVAVQVEGVLARVPVEELHLDHVVVLEHKGVGVGAIDGGIGGQSTH